METQPPFGASCGRAATLSQGLHDGHAPLDTIRTGPLRLAIDIKNRSAMDINDVSARKNDVLIGFFMQIECGNIDDFAEGFAVTHTAHNGDIVAVWRSAPRQGQHVTDTAKGVERKPPRPVDLTEYAYLVAAHLQENDIDLGLADESAALESVGDFLLGSGNIKSSHIDTADQRISDVAILRHTRFCREIGVLKNLDAQNVAG